MLSLHTLIYDIVSVTYFIYTNNCTCSWTQMQQFHGCLLFSHDSWFLGLIYGNAKEKNLKT